MFQKSEVVIVFVIFNSSTSRTVTISPCMHFVDCEEH
jgi:hypothetical protein